MATDFAHLHVHGEYSLLDGYSRTQKLVSAAKSKGMEHLALTDHGAMYGAIEFYKECAKQGIHPVIGLEAYLCEDMADHTKRYSDDYSHLLLLAKNDTGYSNLLKLTTIAHTEGWHLRPRIDRQALARHSDGLFGTSSCLSGEIPKLLLAGRREEAYRVAGWYRDVFGEGQFYLEIQDHDPGASGSDQTRLNQLLFQMHQETQIPLVLTNDLHYVEREDADSQDVLLCVQTGKRRNDPTRTLRFEGSEFFLKGPTEMALLFPDLPEALSNTVRIAEQCRIDPLARRAKLPTYFPVPSEHAVPDLYLYELCLRGVTERFGDMTNPIKERLDYEFRMIAGKGFVNYFLIQWDVVNYARSHGIRCCARGSAAGSLLAYVLGITNVNPLKYNLLFERFFNTERSDMPDIDMDYPDDKRDEVIAYVAGKYGYDCVAQMVTFNTMAAKASVKDVARVMGVSDIGDRITRAFPRNHKGSLSDACMASQELSALRQNDQRVRDIIEQALKLEGSVRGTGVHAAGVIISNEPLDRFVPLQLRDPKDARKGRITQYEQKHLEELGLIKFDFLGLANLTILRTAVEFIQQTRDETIDLDKLPLEPVEGNKDYNAQWQAAFDLLASGETGGVFQLDGPKMREYIKQLKPTCIEDLTAMVALYRPGPMDSIPEFIDAKHGRKKVSYLDMRLAEWLAESYGIIVYQDQVLLIAVNMAGFSWGKVNKFRKALSKKIMHEVEGYREDFITGCVERGMQEEVAGQLFTLVEPFGGYGFNKAHAASYAVVAFHCAFLKANYTAEFMAATLSTHASDAKKVPKDIAECRRLDIAVMGPDINRSGRGFTVESGGVRFGLLAIRGIGDGPISEILRVRAQEGPFTSLSDFCKRVDTKSVGKSVIETLIKAGAFDALAEGKRRRLHSSVEAAQKWARSERQKRERGMVSLFGDLDEVDTTRTFLGPVDVVEWTHDEILELEHQFLGVYISGHPLQDHAVVVSAWSTHTTDQVTEDLEHQSIIIGGLLGSVKSITTKRGDQMCTAQIEDLDGSTSVIVFPRTYAATAHLWRDGAIVLVHGDVQVERNDDTGDVREIKLVCNRVALFEALSSEQQRDPYFLHLKLLGDRPDMESEEQRNALSRQLQAVKERLEERRGVDRYDILVEGTSWLATLEPAENTTHYSHGLVRDLARLLGEGAVVVRTSASLGESMV